MLQLFVEYGETSPYCAQFESDSVSVHVLKYCLQEDLLIPLEEARILSLAGTELQDGFRISKGDQFLRLSFRLLGGKGGFGSLLRSGGSGRIAKKKTNLDACRDLSGRRLRSVKDQKEYVALVIDLFLLLFLIKSIGRIEEWLKKEPERRRAEKELLEQRIKDGLSDAPKKAVVLDPEFLKQSKEITESVSLSVEKGLSLAAQEKKKTVAPIKFSSAWDVDTLPDEELDEGGPSLKKTARHLKAH